MTCLFMSKRIAVVIDDDNLKKLQTKQSTEIKKSSKLIAFQE